MTKDGKSSSNQRRYCKGFGCYRTAVVKKKIVDFRVVGETLSCPFCGSNLDDAAIESSRSSLGGLFNDSSDSNKHSISSIFSDSNSQNPSGNGKTSHRGLVFLDDAKEAHFCRDCEFFMYHPYKSYCCKHEKDVSPSDDCMDFSIRKPDTKAHS